MIQFTVRWMLAVTAFAALIFAGLFAFPPVLSAVLAFGLMFAAPGALAGCVVYGRPAWRAFAVGGILPYGMRLFIGSSTVGSIRNAMFNSSFAAIRRSTVAQGPARVFQNSSANGTAHEYLERGKEVLQEAGHVMMIEESVFLSAALIAGFASLAAWRIVGRRATQAGPR